MANPPSYAELLARVQRRSITSEDEAERIRGEITFLLDREELSDDEWAFLALLGDVLSAWETDRNRPEPIPVAEVIRALIEAHGLHQKELVGPVFPTESVGSDVLHGRRKLSYSAVEKLARFFKVSPAVFYPSYRRPT